MLDTLVLKTLDQLRALSDPIRLRIIDTLTDREGTVATLAKDLGESPSRLYPHVDQLLASGLIGVARTVPRRGAEQRWLRAVARDYVLDRDLFGIGRNRNRSLETMLEVACSMLTGVVEDLTAGVRSGGLDPAKPGRSFFIEGRALSCTPAAFAALPGKVKAAVGKASSRGPRYRLVVVGYPADLAERYSGTPLPSKPASTATRAPHPSRPSRKRRSS